MSHERASGASAGPPPAAGKATVRAARREDLSRVWELMTELARYERMTEVLTNTPDNLGAQLFEERWPKVECLVAESDGSIVGYALFFGCYSSFRGKPVIWLEDLCVDQAHRGAGAGKALMRALARLCRERDCVRLA